MISYNLFSDFDRLVLGSSILCKSVGLYCFIKEMFHGGLCGFQTSKRFIWFHKKGRMAYDKLDEFIH